MRIHYVPTVLLLGSALVLLLVAGGLLLKGQAVRRTAQRFRARAVAVRATVVGLEAKDLSLGVSPTRATSRGSPSSPTAPRARSRRRR